MMKPTTFLAALFATVLALFALPANAQTTAYAPGQGAVNSVAVGIDVRASVRDRCGFAAGGAPTGTIAQQEFDRTGFTRDFAIVLNCSSPSRVAVSSLRGGLKTDTSATGYASSAPYRVELRMVADDGTAAAATCDAASLASGGGCAFAGTAGTATGLRLPSASTRANGSYLRVSAPPYAGAEPLLAGSYSDSLVVTVSVAA